MKCNRCKTDIPWLIEAINQKHGHEEFYKAVDITNRCTECFYRVRCLTACKGVKDDGEKRL